MATTRIYAQRELNVSTKVFLIQITANIIRTLTNAILLNIITL